MKLPTEPPENMILVPLAKDCVLLLHVREYLAGIRRGKWWRRRQAMLAREATSEPSPVVASGNRTPDAR
jgi:hypothetical protein